MREGPKMYPMLILITQGNKVHILLILENENYKEDNHT